MGDEYDVAVGCRVLLWHRVESESRSCGRTSGGAIAELGDVAFTPSHVALKPQSRIDIESITSKPLTINVKLNQLDMRFWTLGARTQQQCHPRQR